MSTSTQAEIQPAGDHFGGRFCLNIEGTEHPWRLPTISTEEIAQIGGWDPNQGVTEVNLLDGSERTLKPGESVELQPGHAYCKRIRWQRGLLRDERIADEVALLERHFSGVKHQGDWVLVPNRPVRPGWSPSPLSLAVEIPSSFPGAPPYGIYVPSGTRYDGKIPGNYRDVAERQPPFGGPWGILSWAVEDQSKWQPGATVEGGSNLFSWLRGAQLRFSEGV